MKIKRKDKKKNRAIKQFIKQIFIMCLPYCAKDIVVLGMQCSG